MSTYEATAALSTRTETEERVNENMFVIMKIWGRCGNSIRKRKVEENPVMFVPAPQSVGTAYVCSAEGCA
jgi:hypothetical protein